MTAPSFTIVNRRLLQTARSGFLPASSCVASALCAKASIQAYHRSPSTSQWPRPATSTRYSSSSSNDPQASAADRDAVEGKKSNDSKRRPEANSKYRKTALKAKASRQRQSSSDVRLSEGGAEKTVTAFCGAQEYDMMAVARILRFEGVPIDPTGTSLYPEVIHVEMPSEPSRDLFGASLERNFETGDVFIFPSATVVAWNVPESSIRSLISDHLKSAARGPHELEDESLEYREDASRDWSQMKSGMIVLGTRAKAKDAESHQGQVGGDSPGTAAAPGDYHRHKNTVLAQIAFSSGLEKSTKIAVLEAQLDNYLEDTRDIPQTLMSGSLASVSRPFIYQKMGQLLSMRGQLNLSSDLTDSAPDLLWDTEPELRLDIYHEHILHELDIDLRIKRLNQRMDYAHEIASILREELSIIREERSERTSTRLEWIIIALIAVEVGFGGWHLYQNYESKGVTKVQVVK